MLNKQSLEAANQLFLNSEYQLAKADYQGLLKDNPNNPMLMINLANTEYKLENYGKAIKHYYKAKTITPRSKEANNNLALLNNELRLKQDPMLAFNGLSIFESLVFFLIFNILYLVRKRLKFNSTLNFIVVLFLGISSANLAWLTYEHKTKKRIVITEISTKAYSGDNEAYSELFELLDGQILDLVKRDSQWSQIRYDSALGWIKNSSYEFIGF